MCTNPSNPLIRTLVNRLRDETLNPMVFKQTIREIAKQMLGEALRDHPLVRQKVMTWKGEMEFEALDESAIMVVSVLRAALPMHEALIETLPHAVSGFLGIKRDEETHQSVLYYDRVGDCSGKTVLLVDTMVATGGSLCDAVEIVKNKGAKVIKTLHVIASPEGIRRVQERYGEIEMFVAQIDERLDENKFIVPGLGDAGDRAYNTL